MTSFSPATRNSWQNIQTPHGNVPYLLIRSDKRRTLALHINEECQLRVLAPIKEEDRHIRAFILKHVGWIEKKSREIENWMQSRRLVPKFRDGERLLFLGKEYPLSVRPSTGSRVTVEFNSSEGWLVGLSARASPTEPAILIRNAMVQWYKGQAVEIFGSRVFHYSRLMSLEPLKITVKTQKTMWGSCHPTRKSINLNWKIIMAPIDVIDYVIVHELSHIRVPNHSSRFWDEVKNVFPDYKTRHQWLKDNALRLSVEDNR